MAGNVGTVSGFGKMALVVRREFIERVRNKWFIISTILVPVFLGTVMFAPFLIMRLSPAKQLRIAVVDDAGGLFPALDESLSSDPDNDFMKAPDGKGGKVRRYELEEAPAGASEAVLADLSKRVEEKSLDAYLLIPSDIVAGKSEPTYYGRTVSNIDSLRRIERGLTDVLVAKRLSGEGVDSMKVKELTRRVDLQTMKIGEKGRQSKKGFIEEYMVTMVFVILLYMNLILYGSALARGLIEEKTNRVIEVLLSSLTPFQLMAGKIIGVGAAGLAQFLIWSLAAVGFSMYRGGGGSEEMSISIEPATLAFFLLYFVLGFFLYAALFCIVGATCTTEQEAQAAQQPVVMLLVVPMVIAMMIVTQPASTLAVVMSHIPFFSPIVMFMRINILAPPAWEIALNVVATLATIAGVVWVAARVFRVGILMTGKRATIPEIIRWVRAA